MKKKKEKKERKGKDERNRIEGSTTTCVEESSVCHKHVCVCVSIIRVRQIHMCLITIERKKTPKQNSRKGWLGERREKNTDRENVKTLGGSSVVGATPKNIQRG